MHTLELAGQEEGPNTLRVKFAILSDCHNMIDQASSNAADKDVQTKRMERLKRMHARAMDPEVVVFGCRNYKKHWSEFYVVCR